MSTVIDVLHSVLYFVQLVATVLVDENLLEELYELSVMGGLGGRKKKLRLHKYVNQIFFQ